MNSIDIAAGPACMLRPGGRPTLLGLLVVTNLFGVIRIALNMERCGPDWFSLAKLGGVQELGVQDTCRGNSRWIAATLQQKVRKYIGIMWIREKLPLHQPISLFVS